MAGVNINRVRMGDSSGGRDREIRDREWERERERLLMSDSKEGHRYERDWCRIELETKVIRRFPKISGPSPGCHYAEWALCPR